MIGLRYRIAWYLVTIFYCIARNEEAVVGIDWGLDGIMLRLERFK